MKVTVIEGHLSSFPDPVRLKKGDEVKVGKRDTEFTGWRMVTDADGKSGWAPEILLEVNGNIAFFKEDYDARELNVEIGDIITVYREIDGWYWVSNASGEYGWVPVRNVTEASRS